MASHFSHFSGTGAYLIVPAGNPELSVNLEGSNTASGTPIILWPKEPETDNTIWFFSQQSEGVYNIINKVSRLFLTDTGDRNSGVLSEQSSPEASAVRWKVVPVENERGHFHIININGETELNVSGSKFVQGTKVLAWPLESGLNTKFELFRRDD